MRKSLHGAVAPGFPKAPCSIVGFDEITHGGLPRHRSSLIVGGVGSGKTLLALQTLVNGALMHGEPGIFVAFEESRQQIEANSAAFGWDLMTLQQQNRLYILDAQLSPTVARAGTFDLTGMLAILRTKVDEMQAQRIVFDGVDVLLTLLLSPALELQEVHRIREWLADVGLTGVFTAKLDANNVFSVRHYEFMQFMADCVVRLEQRLDAGITVRKLQVVKYRGSGFAEGEFPMCIGDGGIEVAIPTPIVADYPVFTERISAGFGRLDTMLGGGYYRGSSVLITGAPGTAKTSLTGTFVEAACRRGEPTLYVSFDEGVSGIVRNLRSVGIDLEPHRQSGLLIMYAGRTEACNPEEHLIRLVGLMRDHQPSCMVIDPVSALIKSGGLDPARNVINRLLYHARRLGITLVLTALVDADRAEHENSELQISTLADTWIHLSYLIQAGERNRALTIVKSRGTPHSNQVRELLLSADGLTLTDVYLAGGDVLMGTLRWEKENAEAAQEVALQTESAMQRRRIEAKLAETQARIEALQRELDWHELELQQVGQASVMRQQRSGERAKSIGRLRSADLGEPAEATRADGLYQHGESGAQAPPVNGKGTE